MITSVSKVVVPVDDQERAKLFRTTPLGFALLRASHTAMSAGSR